MPSTALSAATVLGGLAGLAGFAYYVANIADEAMSKQAKHDLLQRLSKISLTRLARHSFAGFLVAADRWYGPRLFSVRALVRSAVMSSCWILLVSLINYKQTWTVIELLDPALLDVMSGAERAAVDVSRLDLRLMVGSVATVLPFILLIDYASTSLSRGLIRWSLGKGPRVILAMPVVDLVLSLIVFVAGYSLTLAAFGRLSIVDALSRSPDWLLASRAVGVIFDVASGPDIGRLNLAVATLPDTTFLYSSLLTSIWLWLYVASYSMLYVAVRVDRLRNLLLRVLDFGEKPFHSIAFILIGVCCLVAGAVIACLGALGLIR
jgi:hypothetical protein